MKTFLSLAAITLAVTGLSVCSTLKGAGVGAAGGAAVGGVGGAIVGGTVD